jgi:hypothetical protein
MLHTLTHTIETDVASYWKLVFDHEFNHAMHRHFGSVCQSIEESTDAAGILHRHLEYVPQIEIPELAKKLVGDGACKEIGRFDRAASTYLAETTPKNGGDKFLVKTEIRVEPAGDARCERVVVMENIVKVFAIGSMLEKLLEQPQRDAQARVVDFIHAWLREKSERRARASCGS